MAALLQETSFAEQRSEFTQKLRPRSLFLASDEAGYIASAIASTLKAGKSMERPPLSTSSSQRLNSLLFVLFTTSIRVLESITLTRLDYSGNQPPILVTLRSNYLVVRFLRTESQRVLLTMPMALISFLFSILGRHSNHSYSGRLIFIISAIMALFREQIRRRG